MLTDLDKSSIIKDISIKAVRNNPLNHYHKFGRPKGRPSNAWISTLNKEDIPLQLNTRSWFGSSYERVHKLSNVYTNRGTVYYG